MRGLALTILLALAAGQVHAEDRQTGPGCPGVGTRSPFTGKNASVYFHNKNGKDALKVYWIDALGQWQPKGEIAPGKSTSFGTIMGARWVLVETGGRCVLTISISLPNSTWAH